MVWPIRPSGFSHGSMKSWSSGLMRILGMMMKVRSPRSLRLLKDEQILSHLVLTWISIFWFSRAGPTASLRIYYEFAQAGDPAAQLSSAGPTIPLGFSYFPREIYRLPKKWVELYPW
jgi:hypothetical protein